MRSEVTGGPSFAYITMELDPGESVTAESDAMSTMSAGIGMETKLNGGLIKGLARKFLGGESLFVNTFTNTTQAPKKITFSQPTPGVIRELDLDGGTIYLQPGAYICSSVGVSLGLQWAGFTSLIAREGLFRLVLSGNGKLWFGAYGGMLDKQIDGEYIVDSGHLVGYDPGIRMKLQLAGGIFSSFFGGEGLVARLEGKGRVILQTRSLSGLVSWINPKLPV